MSYTAELILTLGLALGWLVLLRYNFVAAMLLPGPLLILGMFVYAIVQSMAAGA